MNDVHETYPDTHNDDYSKTTFGFWVYLLTDLMFFASIFAAYAVLSKKTFGGPSAHDLFSLSYSTVQTLVMLTSAFTIGLGGVYAHRNSKGGVIFFFFLSFLLGLCFLGMMGQEFSQVLAHGNSWKTSAFLSIYFSLVGLFGLHMIVALLWVLVLIPPVFKEGISAISLKRLTCLRMFWQFINIVWVFIFTFVYVLGVI